MTQQTPEPIEVTERKREALIDASHRFVNDVDEAFSNRDTSLSLRTVQIGVSRLGDRQLLTVQADVITAKDAKRNFYFGFLGEGYHIHKFGFSDDPNVEPTLGLPVAVAGEINIQAALDAVWG